MRPCKCIKNFSCGECSRYDEVHVFKSLLDFRLDLHESVESNYSKQRADEVRKIKIEFEKIFEEILKLKTTRN